ncbi:MAG: hypothetical protein Q7T20_06935 [Saprospiraceae bacterium]|nr:hypothetical protein [Saprospiraceae bacterium]
MSKFFVHDLRLAFRLVIVFLFLGHTLAAQDLQSIYQNLKSPNSRKLQISGGLNISNSSYYSEGIAARRDAWQWLIGANLNLRFLGINAPFAMYFSDGNKAYRLPSYTFTGISPSYKWATLHLGDRNMNFSRYSLSGIMFRGLGFELKPGKWYAGAMYGRLSRATREDLGALQRIDPVYKRIGYGAKLGYQGNNTSVGLSWFGAGDDENSIATPQLSTVLPTLNAVLSLQASQRLGRKLNLEGEMAHSATNTNKWATELNTTDRDAGNTLLGVFKPNESVQTGNAWRANAQYALKVASLTAGYERIDQGFRTLGALFFLSDVERITGGFNTNLWKNKITLMTNGGVERTDLSGAERNGARRLIGSLSASCNPTERLSFNGSYSNFQNTAKLRTVNDPANLVDSLILAQVTQNISLGASLTEGDPKEPGIWSINLSRQSANSIVNDAVQADAKSKFFTTSLFYAKTRPAGLWNWSAGLSWSNTQLAALSTNILSPTLTASRSFFKNTLHTSSRASYNTFLTQGTDNSAAFNVGLTTDYQLAKSNKIGMDVSLINRTGADNDFLELYGRVFYAYSFQNGNPKKRPAKSEGNQ